MSQTERIAPSPLKVGGLVISHKKDFSSSRLNLQNLHSNDIEIMAVNIVSPPFKMAIINIYSPKGRFSETWLNSLFDQLIPPFVIMGDFNINHQSLGFSNNSVDGENVINWIISNNLNILNTHQPTRISNNSSSLLDLSIVSPDLYIFCSHKIIQDPFDSDHLPIQISINNDNPIDVSVRKAILWKDIERYFSLNHSTPPLFQSYSDFQDFCSSLVKKNSQRN